MSSVLTVPLPQQNDSIGNPLDECLVFLDGYVWGPVAAADIYVAGEKASNVPVQVMIPASSSPPGSGQLFQPSMGPNGNEGVSVDAFGANALIGIGLFQQDCGQACVSNSPPPTATYYDCPASGCNPINVTLAQQLANPVAGFASDNNGVLIQLPAVPDGGSLNVSGSLIFGIGTQSNNALGSATVYPVNDVRREFTTSFNGTNYTSSFIDSGSNAFFFADSSIVVCPSSPVTPPNEWYCPTNSPDNLTAVNQGSNGQSGPTTTFSIENTINLFDTNNTAFSTLGGPSGAGEGSSFDWGLSFFYGRDVFTAIENMNTGRRRAHTSPITCRREALNGEGGRKEARIQNFHTVFPSGASRFGGKSRAYIPARCAVLIASFSPCPKSLAVA